MPVVATDLGGMAEVVQHEGSGLLFPRGDAGALAAALRRLQADAELYGRLAAGRTVPPGMAEVAEHVERLYQEPPPAG